MSVQTLDARHRSPHGDKPAPTSALAHIPGDNGWPLVGHTLVVLADPKGFVERRAERYGPVYRSHAFGQSNVSLLGPDANEFVLLDSQKLFSSMFGWSVLLGRLFPRGLMLLDFDEHRLHRRALSVAFKSGPMQSYLGQLNAGIAKGLAQWPCGREFKFYPAVKQLTLDLAATSFLGEELGPELEVVKRAFIAMVAASVAVIRVPLPGTQMGRGVRGRALIVDYFNRQIPLRRERGGDDLFSQLCRATWEDGSLLSNADIVDHMSFLMMAAHDTLTSSLTSFVYRLAANPLWQERVREDVRGLMLAAAEPLPFSRLDDLTLTEMAFKEAMRLAPPVPSLPRRAVRDFEFMGYRIPAGAADLARPGALRSIALQCGSLARAAQIRLRAVRRRRAYVSGIEFCLHAGQVLYVAFPEQIPSRNRPRLSARLENVAHPLSARRPSRHLGTGLIPDADVASPIAR
jgi:cytochrome P450